MAPTETKACGAGVCVEDHSVCKDNNTTSDSQVVMNQRNTHVDIILHFYQQFTLNLHAGPLRRVAYRAIQTLVFLYNTINTLSTSICDSEYF